MRHYTNDYTKKKGLRRRRSWSRSNWACALLLLIASSLICIIISPMILPKLQSTIHWKIDGLHNHSAENKRNFVLHIGPHSKYEYYNRGGRKNNNYSIICLLFPCLSIFLTFLCTSLLSYTETGTTTIQREVNSNIKLRSQLALDNYNVIEHNVIHDRSVLSFNKTDDSYSFSDEFLAVVEKMKTTGAKSNIFGSSEYLFNHYPRGAKSCSSLQNVLLRNSAGFGEEYWKLHIVFTYRPLYDLLPSRWNQKFKYHFSKNGLPVHVGHTDWPEEGGNRIIPFREWIHTQLDDGKKNQYLQGYNSWKACSDSISVVK